MCGANDAAPAKCQPMQGCNPRLTNLGESAFNRRTLMATDPLAKERNEIGLRIAEIREAGPRLSPLDLYARMDAIRQLAVANGLATLEGLARCSTQLALLPG